MSKLCFVCLFRYLTNLRLTLIKKKAVNDWKQEQLSAKRQLHEEALLGKGLPGSSEDNRYGRDMDMVGAGIDDVNSKPAGIVVSEQERALAKQRIAKWKADQAAKKEEEKV